MHFPSIGGNRPKAAAIHPYSCWSQLFAGWTQRLSKVMEKPATDHSCLWILLCALDYHRSERERGAALQLHNSPTTLLWPAYLNGLTLVTLCRDECTYMLRLLAAGRELALPSMRSFSPFYYIHRNSGATSTSGKKGKKKQQETCTPHEQLGKKKGGGEGGEKKKRKKPVPLINNVGGLKPGCRPGCMSFSYFQPLGIWISLDFIGL